ncbi:MAG TPA: hypothetical protein VND19_16835 [Acetobacteraceae bacterium]|nr:hypothetical protein [Acetobacteraceae bacterium]
MTLVATAEAARANRRRATAGDGMGFWHTLYLGTTRYNMAAGEADPAPEAVFPMAFLVEQDPGEVANAHFHRADQFQVVVAGEGTLGTHAVRPVTVHFAGAFTAYGPIRAGIAGLTYFTLRNGFDPGARYMMRGESRTALRAVAGRRHREAVAAPLGAGGSAVLLGPEPDGMAAWSYHIAPGERLLGPAPKGGRGQYWLVVEGSMWRDAAALGPLSCAFLYPDESPLMATGGPDGAILLAMQFPRRAAG